MKALYQAHRRCIDIALDQHICQGHKPVMAGLTGKRLGYPERRRANINSRVVVLQQILEEPGNRALKRWAQGKVLLGKTAQHRIAGEQVGGCRKFFHDQSIVLNHKRRPGDDVCQT